MTPAGAPHWALTLYVSGASPRSVAALTTVRALCEGELAGQADLTVVDVREEPALAAADEVYAVPTLVKRLPEPLRRLVGELDDVIRLRAGLDLGPVARPRTPRDGPREP